MKKINLMVVVFLFSNVLLSMQEEAAKIHTVIQKLSKSKKRKWRRNLAKRAQRKNNVKICSVCNHTASLIENAFVYKHENNEIYKVKVIFDLDVSPASFQDCIHYKKINDDHSWTIDSWEIPEYAFACWRKRQDEALAKQLHDKKD